MKPSLNKLVVSSPNYKLNINVSGLNTDDTIDALDDEETSPSDAILQDLVAGTTTNYEDSSGYKYTYTSDLNVTRNGNVNVKTLTVTVRNSNGIITILRTQSANIGEVDYYKRMF